MKRRVLAMLLLLAMVLSLIPAVGAENAAESTAEHHLLLTDDFTTLGSWTVENQQTAYNQKNLKGRTTYDPTVPGTDAVAKFTVEKAGTYQIWVHAKHGTAPGYNANPWEFKVGVDNATLTTVFGGAANHANFAWTTGGSLELAAGEHTVHLIDFSANYARCDAVLVTSDANLTPEEDYTKLQKQLTAQTVTYVSYAIANGIIEQSYASYTDAQMNAPITRGEFVHIFHGAKDGYTAISTVADGAIPDVKTGDKFAAEIYELYRAGILTGSDTKGTFHAASTIKRSEAATILLRMYDSSVRMPITLG